MKKYSYTQAEKEILAATPILDVLRDLGFNVSSQTKSLYFSPLREDKTPSFHIDTHRNQWADHGNSDESLRRRGAKVVGGDTIRLVEILDSMGKIPLFTDEKNSYRRALIYLNRFNPHITPIGDEELSPKEQQKNRQAIEQQAQSIKNAQYHASENTNAINIKEVKPKFTSPSLLNYAYERGISPELANRYCRQVHYTVSNSVNPNKEYFAIGFQNIRGQWALRNQYALLDGTIKNIKISTGQGYSAINGKGEFQCEGAASSQSGVLLFEGFFDFLSWMAWNNRLTPGDVDIVVLNSVSNLTQAQDYILSHSKVIAYFDNDQTGRKYSQQLGQLCTDGGVAYYDCAYAYSEHHDLNDAWMNEQKKTKVEKQPEQTQIESNSVRIKR